MHSLEPRGIQPAWPLPGSGVSYQFGTNWAVFSDRAGPIIGPLMAYEVLTPSFWKPASWA